VKSRFGDPAVRPIDRRNFLREMETVVATALCGGRAALPILISACGGARYVTPSRSGMQLRVSLAQVSSPQGAIVEVGDGQLPLYVRQLGDKRFSAVSTRCMHRGCQVEPGSDRLICPCHGSEYSFEGSVLRGPTEMPLVRYLVTSDETQVYIHLDSILTGSPS
jgi:cytochrome b6-f complex iron-sulfur subunit